MDELFWSYRKRNLLKFVTCLVITEITSTGEAKEYFQCSSPTGRDSGPYCSQAVQQGICCKRFGLNVNRDPGVVITSSSIWDSKHGPHRAALFEVDNSYEISGGIAGWSASTNDANQWIQVDFGSPRQVTGILLQGRGLGCCNQWVTSFRVLFSNDGEVFNSTAVMEGTFDSDTVTTRFFGNPIVARYYRINPITWYNHVTLRFDLLDCVV